MGALIAGIAGVGALTIAAALRSPAPTLIIGAVLSESSPRDQAARQGLELAIETLDAELTDERLALEVVEAATPQAAEQQLRALDARGVRLIADLSGPDAVLASGGVLRGSNLIAITTVDDPRLPGVGGERLFCIAQSASAAAWHLAAWCHENQWRLPAVVVGQGALADAQALTFVRAMGGIHDDRVLSSAQGAGKVAEQLAALSPAPPALVLLVPTAEAMAVAQELHARGGRVPVLLSADPLLAAALGASPARALLARLRVAEVERVDPAGRERFLAAWRARHGEAVAAPPALDAWDSVHTLVSAWRAAGGDAALALRHVRATAAEGASGRISFLGDGGREPPSFVRWRFGADGTPTPWSFESEEAAR